MGDDDARGVGVLGVAASGADVVFDIFAAVQGDGVGEHDFTADQDEVVDGGDADEVAVFQQQFFGVVGLGEHDLPGRFDGFGAVYPLQHQVGFFFAERGFFGGAGADGEHGFFQVLEGGLEHELLAVFDGLPEQLQAGFVGAVGVAHLLHEAA